MNIAIVDDQKFYQKIIQQRLYKLNEFNIETYSFSSVIELQNSNINFALILLDIDMPDINGIDYARTHHEENIIFITNYKSYMKEAFGPNVYGFIEKIESENDFLMRIKSILYLLLNLESIIIKSGNEIIEILKKDIIYVQYIRRKTICIKTLKGEYIVHGYGIKNFLEQLGALFIMIDRDIIVNISMIMGINDNKIILRGIQNKMKISKRRIKAVKEAFFSRIRYLILDK